MEISIEAFEKNMYIYFPIFSSSSKNVLHFPLSILTPSVNNMAGGNVPTDSTVTANTRKIQLS